MVRYHTLFISLLVFLILGFFITPQVRATHDNTNSVQRQVECTHKASTYVSSLASFLTSPLDIAHHMAISLIQSPGKMLCMAGAILNTYIAGALAEDPNPEPHLHIGHGRIIPHQSAFAERDAYTFKRFGNHAVVQTDCGPLTEPLTACHQTIWDGKEGGESVLFEGPLITENKAFQEAMSVCEQSDYDGLTLLQFPPDDANDALLFCHDAQGNKAPMVTSYEKEEL